MEEKELKKLLKELVSYSQESEWLEFKLNFHSNEEIGERISAISNGAALNKKRYGFLVFGVEDETHLIKGTTFSLKKAKQGKEELENWLLQRLNPRIDFQIHEFTYDLGINITMLIIPPAKNVPVKFKKIAFIRIGSYTRHLNDFPEKESKIWNRKNEAKFESRIAKTDIESNEVISLLDTQIYFDLLKIPYPSNREAVLDKLTSEKIINKNIKGTYSITNLGAILFAKDLSLFGDLKRKAIRVIVYKGNNKIQTIREQIGVKGYVSGYTGLIDWVNSQLPENEEIGKALRDNKRMYPEIAVRELIANSIIHQDFDEKGFPMIEIFSDRVEITNPGIPLITPERFIDEYQSRNDVLADLMRRLGVCEEKGSGIDKVIFYNEMYQLPAPKFLIQEKHTKIIMYAYKELNSMDKNDKIRACYQHSCLKYVSNDIMTNQSLRDRFNIESKNSAIASRIIKEALKSEMIKEDDPESNSRKYKKYIPFWA